MGSSTRAIKILLVLVIAFQLFLVISDYGWTWARAAVRTAQFPAMKRSSRFLFGSEGSDYIDFLSSVVPTDKPVVKPVGTIGYAEQSLLQFFLLPRGIPACPCRSAGDTSDACATCLLKPSHYVPALGGFPEAYLIENDKELIEFTGDSGWFDGVYVPQSADVTRSPSPMPNTIVSWMLTGGRSLLIFGLIYLAGLIVATSLLYPDAGGWAAAIAFPLGSGLITWLVFLLAWMGMPVSPILYVAALMLLTAPFIAWIIIRARQGLGPSIRFEGLPSAALRMRRHPFLSLGVLTLILLVGLSMLVSVGRAYSLFDGIVNWALKGYAIAYEGSIFAGRNWGGHALEYPQNLHLQIALFRLTDGDSMPGSKIIFSLYFASLIGGCYLFWRSVGTNRALALLGCLVLASIPLIFIHSTIGFANLPMSVMLMLGMLLGLNGINEGSVIKQITASLLLGLAAWTRLEAVLYSLIIAASLLLLGRIDIDRRPSAFALFGPLILIASPWMLFYVSYGTEFSQSLGAINQFAESYASTQSIDLSSIGLIARQLGSEAINIGRWGVVVPLFLLATVFGLLRSAPEDRPVLYTMLIATIIVMLSIVAVYYLNTFALGMGLEVDLQVNFDRHLIPIAIVMVVTAVVALRGAVEPNRTNSIEI